MLGGLLYWDAIPSWLAAVLMAALLAKDLILFPYVRSAYEPGASHGGEALLGAIARVEHAIAPAGWVRIGAETWRARMLDGSTSSAAGEYVEVRGIDDLVLVVAPVAPAGSPSPRPPHDAAGSRRRA